MTHQELAAALAERAAFDDALAPMAAAAAKLSQEHEQTLDALAKARDRADAVAYEDEIRAGKEIRKITGPAHEARVRSSYPTLAELQRYLSTAEPAPALSPEKPGSGRALTETDRKVQERIARVYNTKVDDVAFAQHKEGR